MSYARKQSDNDQDLRNINTAVVANRTIVPFRVGGALRVRKENISLNRAFQRFGTPNVMQQFDNRYLNGGGTSPLFGKNSKITGGNLPGTSISEFSSIINGSGNNFNEMRLLLVTNLENFAIGDLVRVISEGLDINSTVQDVIEQQQDLVITAAYIQDYPAGFIIKTGSAPKPSSPFGGVILGDSGNIRLTSVSSRGVLTVGSEVRVLSDDSTYDAIGIYVSQGGGTNMNIAIPYTIDAGAGTVIEI